MSTMNLEVPKWCDLKFKETSVDYEFGSDLEIKEHLSATIISEVPLGVLLWYDLNPLTERTKNRKSPGMEAGLLRRGLNWVSSCRT